MQMLPGDADIWLAAKVSDVEDDADCSTAAATYLSREA